VLKEHQNTNKQKHGKGGRHTTKKDYELEFDL
jgi:hypothetical protein